MKAKRAIDVLVSLILLVALSPVILLTALIVWLLLGSPVVFSQERPGLGGRLFTLYKFRTMTDQRSPDGDPLPDADRMTSLGRLLRMTSLDELPELVNVLKGDMSLVGPRPLLAEYLDRYTPEQTRRHDVRPGLTGLAQVNGRCTTPFSKRIELDVFYVDHWSLMLDLKILLGTIPTVLRPRGVGLLLTIDQVDDIGLSPNSELGRRRKSVAGENRMTRRAGESSDRRRKSDFQRWTSPLL